ncbi:MAG: 4-oxalocrotonate decarboxylase [Halobacteriovoraceae bacterium]|nr:4-oxalocrotonate decarboxylase [Halobacteriovoraceae bacterium]
MNISFLEKNYQKTYDSPNIKVNLKDLFMSDYAQLLHEARIKAEPIEQLTASGVKLTRMSAYEVQEKGISLRESEGEKVIGLKMGLTSEAKRKQMDLDAPLYGVLTDKMEIQNNGLYTMEGKIHPKAEPEVAFMFSKELDSTMSYDEVFSSIKWAAPAIEILDSRYKQFKYFSMEDVISDNSSSSYFIVGESFEVKSKEDYFDKKLKFLVNGEIAFEGNSNAISDDPLNSILELARLMEARRKKVPANVVILAGAATAAVALEAGMTVSLEVEGMKKVEFKVEA